jgi:hypothetical protein
MAKENYAFFIGQVKNAATIKNDPDGRPSRASISVRTLSRDIYGKTGEFQYNNCEIIVMTGNERLIRDMARIQPFDFIEVKGTVTTKKIRRKVECPECGHINMIEQTACFITPTYVGIRAHSNSRTAGLDYLKSCAEASNIFKGIGRLCVGPEVTNYEDGSRACHYQVAINRKLFLADGQPDIHTDYPWVKSTDELAEENAEVLQVGSLIFIDGYLRAIFKKQKMICGNKDCMSEIPYGTSIMEIIPYSIEYLQNCLLPDSTHISEETYQQIQESIEGQNMTRSELEAQLAAEEEDAEGGADD